MRLYWDGVIGGSPLGGVDLAVVEGQFPGDRAVSDGSVLSRGAAATWVKAADGFESPR